MLLSRCKKERVVNSPTRKEREGSSNGLERKEVNLTKIDIPLNNYSLKSR